MEKVDYLEQDPDIRGQKYVCISFLSPEDVIKNKDVFMFERFLGATAEEMATLWQQMYTVFKDNIDFTDSLKKIAERHPYIFDTAKLQDEYMAFKATNSGKLETEYLEKNNFQTSIRGIKVRGSYETLREAEIRAQVLKRVDAVHNIYIAEVGCWCPWSPNPDEISNSEYAETTLNTLMKSYVENQADKDAFFNLRKEHLKEDAMETNNIKKKLIELEIVEEKATVEDGDGVQEAIEGEDPWMQRKAEVEAKTTDAQAP